MVTNNKEYMREYQRKRLGCKKVYNVDKEKKEGERSVYTKSRKILCDVCNLYTLEGNLKKHQNSRQHQEKLQVLHQLRIELGIIIENEEGDFIHTPLNEEIEEIEEVIEPPLNENVEEPTISLFPSNNILLKPLNNIFK